MLVRTKFVLSPPLLLILQSSTTTPPPLGTDRYSPVSASSYCLNYK